MAKRCNVEASKLHKTLLHTAMPIVQGKALQPSEEHLLAFVVVANQFDLNPLTREIFAFPAKGGGITPIVSIDGWLKIINAHEQFDGMEVQVEFANPGDRQPVSVTVKIHRKDRNHPTIITEYYNECHRNTEPWNQAPARMLRHKGIIQCGRVAFGLSGIVDEDDGEAMMRDVTPAGEGVAAEARSRTERTQPAKELEPVVQEAEVVQDPAPVEDPASNPGGEPEPAPDKREEEGVAAADPKPEATTARAEKLQAIETLRTTAGYSVPDLEERVRRVGIIGPRGKFADLDVQKLAAVIEQWPAIMDADPPEESAEETQEGQPAQKAGGELELK